MAYIGRDVNYGNATADHFVGSGGATYALTYDTSTNGVVVSLDGVVQKNGTDFNITGTSLVFTSVVASPIAIQVIYTGITLGIGTPADGTVTDAKITAMAASKLTGTIADARFPATLPAISGANLTSLPSDITKQASDPTISTNPAGGVGTLILNTTSGKLWVCTSATAGDNTWKAGESGSISNFIGATGGTVTEVGNYRLHTFTTSGTVNFTVATLGNSPNTVVEYLVVAGGGAGGNDRTMGYSGGGGGAGGFLTATSFTVAATSYTVTVGAGGAVGPSATVGSPGGDSVFGTITATGGGVGARGHNVAGGPGGSGGGGSGGSGGGAGGTSTASPNQGNNGGAGRAPGFAGAGGGAGAVGEGNADKTNTGGVGLANSITGSSVYYAGGGGAGTQTNSADPNNAGGNGGGGTGGSRSEDIAATAGGVNLGGGGGGGEYNASVDTGGAGGSGIVIIKYLFQ